MTAILTRRERWKDSFVIVLLSFLLSDILSLHEKVGFFLRLHVNHAVIDKTAEKLVENP